MFLFGIARCQFAFARVICMLEGLHQMLALQILVKFEVYFRTHSIIVFLSRILRTNRTYRQQVQAVH